MEKSLTDKIYLTGDTASKGGLTMGGLRLWRDIRSALKHIEFSKYSHRIYEMGFDDKPPSRVDLGKLGYGHAYTNDDWVAKRPAPPKKALADDQWTLHELYGKHLYTPALSKEEDPDQENRLLLCPGCGGFGLKFTGSGKEIRIALYPADMGKLLYLDRLFEYLGPELRLKLGVYLQARGYGAKDPEKLAKLKELMEGIW